MGRITIEYSTLPRSTDRRIRRIRNFGLLAMAFALLLQYEPPARRLVTNAWWRYQCARYTAPMDKIAFWGPFNTYSTAPSSPACFEHLAGPNLYTTLFLHRLKNGQGSCVVAIVFQPCCDGDEHGETFRLDCIKINRDGSLTPIGTDWDEADYNKRSCAVPLTDLTIFAGQVDQSDPSAFTITYSARDECGCICGWLDDDGKIHFHPSQDPAYWNGNIHVPHTSTLPTNDSGGI